MALNCFFSGTIFSPHCVFTESGGTFSVSPQEKEIVPGVTSLFTALFSPVCHECALAVLSDGDLIQHTHTHNVQKHAGKFFFEELECYVFYKVSTLTNIVYVPYSADQCYNKILHTVVYM